MLVGPFQLQEWKERMRRRVRMFVRLYAIIFCLSVSTIFLFLRGNYKLNHIYENHYVYNDISYKLITPEFEYQNPIDDSIEIPEVFHDNYEEIIPDPEPVVDVSTLPNRVDLRNEFSEARDQGCQNSCLAFASGAMVEHLLYRTTGKRFDMSEAFIYYMSRLWMGMEKVDEGSSWPGAIATLSDFGVCTESMMAYDPFVYDRAPSRSAVTQALDFRVGKFYKVDLDLDILKILLYNGYPIGISVVLFSSFGNGTGGMVPMPSGRETANFLHEGRNHGYHAMVIVGFDDSEEYFIVRNSWGYGFGDGGYCYMPYEYILNTDFCRFACVASNLRK